MKHFNFIAAITAILIILSAKIIQGDSPRTLYVINSSAETISKMNMDNGAILPNIVTTGQWPNQVLVHNNMLYLINSGTDDIMVVDPLNDRRIMKTIALRAGSNPYSMTFVGRNRAYVTSLIANTVAIIDVVTGDVLTEIPVGEKPQGILYLGDPYFGHHAFVANTANIDWGVYGQGSVSVIDASVDSVIHTIDMPINPSEFAVDPSGNVHVLCTGDYGTESAKIVVINRYGGADWNTPVAIDTIDIGGAPGDIAITPSGKGYCVAWGDGINGYLYSYDALADTVIRGVDNPILIGPNVSRLLYDEKENVLWIPFMSQWGGDGFVQKFDVELDSIVWTSSVLGNGTLDLAILEAMLDSSPWADSVISFHSGSQWTGFGSSFFPENVLGSPDPDPSVSPYNPSAKPQEILSLGNGGEIVLQFIDNKIINGPGSDFTVFENPFISFFDGSVNVETGIVSVSQDGVEWHRFPFDTTTLSGLAGVTPTNDTQNATDPAQSGGDQFDLADLHLEWAGFVKITDMGDQYKDKGDFDLDAVVAIHSAKYTGIEANPILQPVSFVLDQNYPNPFNPKTIIRYKLSSAGWIRLKVFNLLGEEVDILVDGIRQKGDYAVEWDGLDSSGKIVGSGVYLYQLTCGSKALTKKMTLMR